MKTFISKISYIFRELFAFLHVTVTLQLGKAKVGKDGNHGCDNQPEKEDVDCDKISN